MDMDDRCPKCGLDLSKAAPVQAAPKMKGAFAEFIEKRPLICPYCQADLELSQHSLVGLRTYFRLTCYVLIWLFGATYQKFLSEFSPSIEFFLSLKMNEKFSEFIVDNFYFLYILLLIIVFIKLDSCAFKSKIKLLTRYKIYENNKKSDFVFGYILGVFLYSVFFILVCCVVTMIASSFFLD